MAKPSDIRVLQAALYFIPVQTRMPLKFGSQVVENVVCARVRLTVENRAGQTATGWGEVPLSAAWAWPSSLSWEEREQRMKDFCVVLAKEAVDFGEFGHPFEIGVSFERHRLHSLIFETRRGPAEAMPLLAALLCYSAFDLAAYDAFANLLKRPVFQTLGPEFLNCDLTIGLGRDRHFFNRYPADYIHPKRGTLPVWHLVGGLDPLDPVDLTGYEPDDGHPVMLRDWIKADGLKCLKIKLRGNEAEWDFDRIVRVGEVAIEMGCLWLSADFNCSVKDAAYVCEILDRLIVEKPRIYGMLLYIEQPFPYDLTTHRIDVRSVSARKPLFLDESAHDWHFVRTGRELGWSGVALKTCKTLTGALLSLCWARQHGMTIMVQDLTNPMLAQIPHVLLGQQAGTIMGVESNSMQFYPEASAPEREVHPGIYRRKQGALDLSTLGSSGFGYRLDEIKRDLPEPAFST